MSPEQLRRIVIVLGGLVALWVVLRVVRGFTADDAVTLPVPTLDRAAVDSVVIARPDDTIRLVRGADSSWSVNGLAASGTALTELLDAVADTGATSELVAESRSTHDRLGVDSAQARRLTVLADGDAVVEYLVGKRGASYESAYVRRPGRDNVFQVRGRLVDMTERRLDDWRDKAILHVPADSITALEIDRGRESYTLTKSDSGWRFAGGGQVDTVRMGSLLGQFSRLDASGFATRAQADSASFEPPDRRVRVVGPGGKTRALLVFDSASTGFWVRRDSLPTIYRIDSWVMDQLAPSDSSLRKTDTSP